MSNWYKPRYKIVKRLQEKTFIARLGRLRFFQDRRVQKFLRWKKGPLGRHTRGMTSLSWYKLRFSFGLKFYNFSTKKRRKFRFFRQDNLYKVELSRKKGFLSFYRKIDNSKVINWFNKFYKNSKQFKLLNFFRTFESRLDVLCFRLKLTPTIFVANFFIKNRGLSVNHRLVNIPGYRLQIGDLIHFNDPKVWNFFSLRLTNLLWKRWHRHQEINKVRRQTRLLTYREVLSNTSEKKKLSPSKFLLDLSARVRLREVVDLNKTPFSKIRKEKTCWFTTSKEGVKYFQLFYNLFLKNNAQKLPIFIKKLLLKIIYGLSISRACKRFTPSLVKFKTSYWKLMHPVKKIGPHKGANLKNVLVHSSESQSAVAQNMSNQLRRLVRGKLLGVFYSLNTLEWLSSWIKGAAFLIESHNKLKKILQFLMINFSVNSDLRIFFLRLWHIYRKVNAPLYKLTQTNGRLFRYLRMLSRVSQTLPKKLHPTLFRSLYLKVLTLQFSSYNSYKEIISSYSNKNILSLIQLVKTFLLPLRLSADIERAKKSFNDYKQKINKTGNLVSTNFEDSLKFFSKNSNFLLLYKQIKFRSKVFSQIFNQLRKEKAWINGKAFYEDLNLLFFSFTLNYLQDEFSFETTTSTKISYKMKGSLSVSKSTIDSLLFRNFISFRVLQKNVLNRPYFEINKFFVGGIQKQVHFNNWRRVKFRSLHYSKSIEKEKWLLSNKDLRFVTKTERLFPRSYTINFKGISPLKPLKQSLSSFNSLVIMRERFYARRRIQKRELLNWKKMSRGFIFTTSLLRYLFKRLGRVKHLPPLSKKIINNYLTLLSQKERQKLFLNNEVLFKSLRFSVLNKNSLFVNKYKKILWNVLRSLKTGNTEKLTNNNLKRFSRFFSLSNASKIKWKKRRPSNRESTSLSRRLNLLASLKPNHHFLKKVARLTVNQRRSFLRKRQVRRKTGIQTWWSPSRNLYPRQKSKTRAQNSRFSQKNLAHFIYSVKDYKKPFMKKTHRKLVIRYYTQLRQNISSLLKGTIVEKISKSSFSDENLFRNLFVYRDSQNFAWNRLKYTTILMKPGRSSDSVSPVGLPRTSPLNGSYRYKIKRYKKSAKYRHNWNTNLVNNKWYSIRSKIHQFHKLRAARRQKFTNIKGRPLLLFPSYVEFDFVAFRALIITFPNLEASLYGGADNSYLYNLLNFYQRKGL